MSIPIISEVIKAVAAPILSIIDKAVPDKDQAIVLYCRSGSMSSSTGKELADLGYTNIIELKGGYNAWNRAGGDMMMR